ncbi:DNA polymerase III subunit delta' [Pontixanthobacter aestiaquae]|uniref:DNA polymerase III subunit delta n=1 Tax=Pontixanthobacter aestiaquae TaxID=1509367 RepID=A0A844Z8F7_9SPHN|nr:DNA polymerase III subunit delta' [Pontixanthobacter aestiaquae]MDN3645398.1 DNA polymerase III subunit delta' [Pontixanthobacter aestiaquae]MXO83602.1 DNA polymerase III subunit delta' [Pontixanthobacter aestiaquae]
MTMLGHETPWQQWREALAGERMHHAWMLAGKRGLGKMRFAMAAARELVAEDGLPQPDSHHPDIIVLNRLPKDDKEDKKRADGKPYETKRNIAVSQIRAMQQRLNTRPTLGSRRAIIIDPSDDLEKGASNALLKSLEEPPIGTYFLLVTHRPARLLPTIRSRCRIVRFPTINDDDMARLLSAQAPDTEPATQHAAIVAANGSPGAALDFVERDLGPLFKLMQDIIAQGDPDFMLRGRLADAIGARPNRERIQATLDLARSVVSGAVDQASRANYPAIVDAHAELVKLTGQAPTFNFDAGLLVAEIGTLLASAAPNRERANV